MNKMALKYREEIVGKRFLCVNSSGKPKLSRISDWDWKAGVIRASSHRDIKNSDLSVNFFRLLVLTFVSVDKVSIRLIFERV